LRLPTADALTELLVVGAFASLGDFKLGLPVLLTTLLVFSRAFRLVVDYETLSVVPPLVSVYVLTAREFLNILLASSFNSAPLTLPLLIYFGD